MSLSPAYRKGMTGVGVGLVAGLLFTFLAGDFDPARYLIEQLTLIPFEALFITLAAYITRKHGLPAGILYLVSGSAGATMVLYPALSVTGVVFLKNAVMGILVGESLRFGRSFAGKLAISAAPGVVFAGVTGFPMVYQGVSAETLADIKQEALDMYLTFMTPDDARNAAENAISLLNGVFGGGVAVLVLGTIASTWIAFHVLRLLYRKNTAEVASVPSLSSFSMPFPVMWVFLVSFGLVLAEPKLVYPAALNILLVTAGLYGVQGIAVITHFMNRTSMGRMLRVLFWLIFFITLAFSTIIFVFIGIIDNWFHLRSVPSAPGAAGGNEGTDNEGNSEGRR